MRVLVKSERGIEELRELFTEKIESLDFSVLHVHNMQNILEEHGVPLKGRCYIYSICNAELAKAVFSTQMSMCLVLPCRVCIFEEENSSWIGMISPTFMMEDITGDHAIKMLVKRLEEEITTMLERSL